ncbi:FAD-dependent oxidoreductase [Stigmatella erecta]|uniref:D-amino-acid oxidase n=1 Tax=Stigmatella erecta TaxID=83460 RepID=A0A1I0L6P9_9BACT|nr:FAD-dependent oxidoreductase [Stigmatella erecta]SEU35564.1 D-amino-acid:oxygen oxidoreductase [Stigmatella erecta]
MDIVVLGGGVSGLSSAIRLREAGHAVQLWARELSPHTTSDVAAAIWYPYLASPKDRVLRWGQRTLEVLRTLADQPETGVHWVQGTEVFTEPVRDPWWAPSVPGFRRAAAGELPPGYTEGYAFAVPVIEMPRYLPFLQERFRALGGHLIQREVHALEEAWSQAPTVVNCTGLGARELVGDEALLPIRGEVLRVSPSPTRQFLLDDNETRGMAYVIPRATDCILGGTAEAGSASLTPSASQAEGILARCRRLLPEGTPLNVVEHKVGLRPGRPSVRLEAEQRAGRRVIHNYGHGGAGVTLSWGCAEEVRALVEAGH